MLFDALRAHPDPILSRGLHGLRDVSHGSADSIGGEGGLGGSYVDTGFGLISLYVCAGDSMLNAMHSG